MINYNIIARTVARRAHVPVGTALSAVGEAYLSADLTRGDAQVAAYLIRKAQFVLLTEWTRRDILGDALDYSRGVKNRDGDVEEMCPAPETHPDDVHFAHAVGQRAEIGIRAAVVSVVLKLLDHAPTKPLTAETVRQILKADGFASANVSKTAREVLAFLHTIGNMK